LKNIIITGPSRAGKTTLAKKINDELDYFVINLDMLMTVFGRAYPQLDVRIAWDYDKATANVAPFIGHYLGTLTANQNYSDGLNLRKHDLTGNRFVLEGGHFDFDKISAILNMYGIEKLKDSFVLIGLVQNKTVDELFNDLKRYDKEDDWTYDFDDDGLKNLCKTFVADNQKAYEAFVKYGFTIYDTSVERERVFAKIIEDIRIMDCGG
jgi:uridine kinase